MTARRRAYRGLAGCGVLGGRTFAASRLEPARSLQLRAHGVAEKSARSATACIVTAECRDWFSLGVFVGLSFSWAAFVDSFNRTLRTFCVRSVLVYPVSNVDI